MPKWLHRLSLGLQALSALILILYILTEVNELLGWLWVILGGGWAIHSIVEAVRK